MKRLLAVLVIVALAAQVAPAIAANNAPAPPQSSAFGKPLAEWMRLHTMWNFHASASDHVGHVYFLPLPQGDAIGGSGTYNDPAVLQGATTVNLRPGSAFVLPVATWIGETYDPTFGYPDDEKVDPATFLHSTAWVTIDGRSVFDSAKDDLGKYYFEADLKPPIMYAQPSDYHSIGAIWIQGIGFVHPPLSVGRHTLRLQSELRLAQFDIGVEYHNTWTIIVKP